MMTRDLLHVEQSVMIPSRHGHLMGTLCMAAAPHGVVVVAHASDDIGHEHGRLLAQALQRAHVCTLQVGLLTVDDVMRESAETGECAPVDRLAEHMVEASDWLEARSQFRDLPLGYFGMESGGAAALIAAAERPHQVVAVATCDARMELADRVLEYVHAPVLLLVNERDYDLLSRSEEAATRLRSDRQVTAVREDELVPLASEWLKRYVAADADDSHFLHAVPIPAVGRTH